MKQDILWIIARPKETLKIIFKLSFIERILFKWLMKKKQLTLLKNKEKLRGRTFTHVMVDELAQIKY